MQGIKQLYLFVSPHRDKLEVEKVQHIHIYIL